MKPLKTPLRARLLTKDHCAPCFYQRDGEICLIIAMDDGGVPEIGFNCKVEFSDKTTNTCNFRMWLELVDLDLAPKTHKTKEAATAWILVEAAREAHKDNFGSRYYTKSEEQ